MSVPILITDDDRFKVFSGRGRTGLSNLGNTCFMNTILQCLCKTYDFTEYMLCGKKDYRDNLYKRDITRKPAKTEIENIQKHLVVCWEKLLFAMYDLNTVVGPRSIHNCIQALSIKMGRIEFVGHGQKDAEEFYGFLMEQLHLGLAHKINFTISGTAKNKIDEMAIEAAKSWKAFFGNEYSEIVKLFYGQEYSLITCPKCGFESGTYQPMNRINIPVPDMGMSRESVSLKDCLQIYSEGETLDKENKWICEGCKESVCAKKRLSIWRKPKNLVIHLKRFTKEGRKINTTVDFPLIGLSIKDYCIGYGIDSSKYDLYAIANHTGGMGGGHYYAYCRDYDNNWREYNDSSINTLCSTGDSEERLSSILKKNTAYLLFYRIRN